MTSNPDVQGPGREETAHLGHDSPHPRLPAHDRAADRAWIDRLHTVSADRRDLVDDAYLASSEHARGRPGGVVPRLDRVVAGAAVLERLHDMTTKAAGLPSMPRFTYLGTQPYLRGNPVSNRQVVLGDVAAALLV